MLKMNNNLMLENSEKDMLAEINDSVRFPIARFELRCKSESSVISTALNHVYIKDLTDSMETVKQRAAVFTSLVQKGLINISYHLPVIVKSDYDIYLRSDLFKTFTEMVAEGKNKPGFLFDTPYIKKGFIALSDKGKKAAMELL